MKKIIFLMGILIWICGSEIMFCQDPHENDPTINRENFGKVVGQIIDPETGKPVKVKFKICVFNWNYREANHERYQDCEYYTDENGYITFGLPPGTYGLLFYPWVKNSKYTDSSHPFYEDMPEEYKEMFRCVIEVETKKITRFVRKAIIGGEVKVTLVDLAGNPLNPAVAFPGRTITIQGELINYNLAPGSPSCAVKLENGTFSLKSLFPDNSWELTLDFYGIGYGRFKKKDIIIKPNKVTVINVAIDPNDITGVEGKILDQHGNPLKKVRISFYQKDESIEGDFDCFTDSNGHYMMTGMHEGFYEVEIFDGYEYYLTYKNITIEIKKNILLKRDFTIPASE